MAVIIDGGVARQRIQERRHLLTVDRQSDRRRHVGFHEDDDHVLHVGRSVLARLEGCQRSQFFGYLPTLLGGQFVFIEIGVPDGKGEVTDRAALEVGVERTAGIAPRGEELIADDLHIIGRAPGEIEDQAEQAVDEDHRQHAQERPPQIGCPKAQSGRLAERPHSQSRTHEEIAVHPLHPVEHALHHQGIEEAAALAESRERDILEEEARINDVGYRPGPRDEEGDQEADTQIAPREETRQRG